jgi:hypothetical protein
LSSPSKGVENFTPSGKKRRFVGVANTCLPYAVLVRLSGYTRYARLVYNASRLPWLRFSVLLLSRKTNSRRNWKKGHCPPHPIMEALLQSDPHQEAEAFSQSDPIPLGSAPRCQFNQSSFRKGRIAWWVRFPFRGNSPRSEHVKVFSQDNKPVTVSISPVSVLRPTFPVPAMQEWFKLKQR